MAEKKEHYINYIGQFVKRFYAPFKEKNIYTIKDYRLDIYNIDMFLYSRKDEEFWADCEDSCIITNEMPILEIDWVANVNDSEYVGYNPFN